MKNEPDAVRSLAVSWSDPRALAEAARSMPGIEFLCCVQTKMPDKAGYTTLEAKTNLVRPITASTGRLRAIGKVVHIGSRIATAEGRIEDAAGKLYAHATTTCIVLGGG